MSAGRRCLVLGICLWTLFVGGNARATEPAPTDQTLIYYNARMALREGAAEEAVKLWLLRNAVAHQTGQVSGHDADFRSVTWAALGELGLCQDGLLRDRDGAGLWPLALHNWLVRRMGRQPPPKLRPFKAFEVGRQQRFFSIHDVLSLEEFETAQLLHGPCLGPQLAMLDTTSLGTSRADREALAPVLVRLLTQARETLDAERVRGMAVIEARRFDLELQRTAMAARQASRQTRNLLGIGRARGMSQPELAAMRADAPTHALDPSSEPAKILQASARWPSAEWMSLEPARRRFLFDEARAYHDEPEAFDAIALGVIDALIARRQGAEVGPWIARLQGPQRAAREAVWAGARGRALLGLDREDGFAERAVIALHRGVRQVEGGELDAAMRSFAFALEHAPDSSEATAVQALSRRWLSYVVSRFESTPELLVTLQALVPTRDYAAILEDLMWRAAFHADAASFQRGMDHTRGRGALVRRIGWLQPLARGEVGQFAVALGESLRTSPSEALRFVEQLVERLELEDAELRLAHRRTLQLIQERILPLAGVTEGTGAGRQARTAERLYGRIQAIVEAQGPLGPEATARDRARALSPTAEVFAGSVRLIPADPLPWPFATTSSSAPSAFTPLRLLPEERRDGEGNLIFGWRIEG